MQRSNRLTPPKSRRYPACWPSPLAPTHLTSLVCSRSPKTNMRWRLKRCATLAIWWPVWPRLTKQRRWKPSTCSKSNTKFSNRCSTPKRAWKIPMNQFTGGASITWLEQMSKSECSKNLVIALWSRNPLLLLTESGTWLVFTMVSLNLMRSLLTGTQTVACNSIRLNKCHTTPIVPWPQFWTFQCIKSTSSVRS